VIDQIIVEVQEALAGALGQPVVELGALLTQTLAHITFQLFNLLLHFEHFALQVSYMLLVTRLLFEEPLLREFFAIN